MIRENLRKSRHCLLPDWFKNKLTYFFVSLCYQTSASNTSVSHQPKGSSGTDTGAELTSGSDTEAAPTTLEQTFSSPPKARKKESNPSSSQAIERPAKTTADIPRDLPTDSLLEEKPTVKIPTPNEDTPMVAEMPSSSEAPMSKEVALDSSCLTLERQSSTPVETKVNPAPTEGTAPKKTNTVVPGAPITVTTTAEVENQAASINPGGGVLAERSEPSGGT